MIDRKSEDMLDDMTVSKDWKKDDRHHKAMTMDDVSKELEDDFEDEIHDSKKYMHMSRVAEKHGDYEESYYLLEMSKDEFTHAEFIHDYLEEHDIDIPEELEEKYKKLEEEMAEFF